MKKLMHPPLTLHSLGNLRVSVNTGGVYYSHSLPVGRAAGDSKASPFLNAQCSFHAEYSARYPTLSSRETHRIYPTVVVTIKNIEIGPTAYKK